MTDFLPKRHHLCMIPEEQKFLLRNGIVFRLCSQHKHCECIRNVLMEVVCSISADIMVRMLLIIVYPGTGIDFPPEGIIKFCAERTRNETCRIVRVFVDAQVDLCLIFQQDMSVLMQNRISQFAPVTRNTVFIINIIIVDVDGKTCVVRGAILRVDRRSIREDIAVSVRKQVEL